MVKGIAMLIATQAMSAPTVMVKKRKKKKKNENDYTVGHVSVGGIQCRYGRGCIRA